MKFTLNDYKVGGSIANPEFRTTKAGKTYFTCSIATPFYNSITKEYETMWHKIVCYIEKEVELLEKQNISKGDKIIAIGELIPNNYTNKDEVKVESYQVLAREFVIIHKNTESNNQSTKEEIQENDSIPF